MEQRSSSTRRNGGSSWTTPAQMSWLELQLPNFRAAQLKGQTSSFLIKTYESFIEKWPITSLDAKAQPGGATATALIKHKRVSAVPKKENLKKSTTMLS